MCDTTIFQPVTLLTKDLELPIIYPITGIIGPDNFKNICMILNENINTENTENTNDPKSTDITKILFDIKSTMQNAKQAVIQNKNTGDIYIDKTKRNCNRITFGTDIVKQIIPFIESDIKNSFYKLNTINIPTEIKIDESHFDILYYGKNGHFNLHRDGIPENPYKDNRWKFYSMIIGLDSNLDNTIDGATIDGATMVYLPSREFIYRIAFDKDYTDEFIKNNKYIKKMHCHIYNQTYKQAQFVIFPAEALHSSLNINQDDKFKMALKIDLWCKQPTIVEKSLSYFHECKCVLCNNNETKINTRNDCFCSDLTTGVHKNCICTCVICIYKDNNNIDNNNIDNGNINNINNIINDKDYDEDENICNGYGD